MNALDRFFTRWWLANRASLAVLLKRKATAIDIYRQIVALSPRDENARAALGNLLMEAGDVAGATAEFVRIVETNPRNAEAWFNLGYIYEQRDDLAKAERCFREAIALKPSIDRAWYGLGLVLIRAQRLTEAVDALKKNTELQPFSPYGWYQLAMTYHHLGETAKARRIYEELRKFEPRYAATLKRDMERTPPVAAPDRSAATTPSIDRKEAVPSTH
ncbi:tetratricopeptide repeat protein [Betaproteobacteria bacterium PRO7]|jgi:Flp pilus assembly protein TadD|nr:tetratricopeptide repeat protein [Betaproteobacteria bacterium PRO7]